MPDPFKSKIEILRREPHRLGIRRDGSRFPDDVIWTLLPMSTEETREFAAMCRCRPGFPNNFAGNGGLIDNRRAPDS